VNPERAMSPFCPTILPFLITSDGDGILSMAAANVAGSIPTSWGVAVSQLPDGYSAALVCGEMAGSGVFAPTGEVILVATAATAKTATTSGAISRIVRFVFPLARLDVRRHCLWERFSDIVDLYLSPRPLAAPIAYTSIEAHCYIPLTSIKATKPHREPGGFLTSGKNFED
jgi:hypothetical protein